MGRTTMLTRATSISLVASVAGVLYLATGFPPRASLSREPRSEMKFGWCRGVVRTAGGRPIPNVIVTIRSDAITRSVTTSGAGAFDFDELPAGVYAVLASREGYVRLYLGQSDPVEPMRTIAIGAGRGVDGLEILLPEAGGLRGRVYAPDRRPMSGALISAHRIGERGSTRALMVDGLVTADPTTRDRTARTDHAGYFTLRNLPPGAYVVSAVVEDAQDQALAAVEHHVYRRTYFHDAATEALAREISVKPGAPSYGEWSLHTVPAITLSGTVLTSNGRPASGAIMRVLTQQDSRGHQPIAGRFTGSDGSFSIAVPG